MDDAPSAVSSVNCQAHRVSLPYLLIITCACLHVCINDNQHVGKLDPVPGLVRAQVQYE